MQLSDAPFLLPRRPDAPRVPLTQSELAAGLAGIGDRDARALEPVLAAQGVAATEPWRPIPDDPTSYVLPDGTKQAGRIHDVSATDALVDVGDGVYRIIPFSELRPYVPPREVIRQATRRPTAELHETRKAFAINAGGDLSISLIHRAGLRPDAAEVEAYVQAQYPGYRVLDADDARPGQLVVIAAPPARARRVGTATSVATAVAIPVAPLLLPLVNRVAALGDRYPGYRLELDGEHVRVLRPDGGPLFVTTTTDGRVHLSATLAAGAVPALAAVEGDRLTFLVPDGRRLALSDDADTNVDDDGDGDGNEAATWEVAITFTAKDDEALGAIDTLLDGAVGMPSSMVREGDHVAYQYEFDTPEEAQTAMDLVLGQVRPEVSGLEVTLHGLDLDGARFGGAPSADASNAPSPPAGEADGAVIETIAGPDLEIVAEAPPGEEDLVRELKEREDVENPFALAWAIHKRKSASAVTGASEVARQVTRRVLAGYAQDGVTDPPAGNVLRCVSLLLQAGPVQDAYNQGYTDSQQGQAPSPPAERSSTRPRRAPLTGQRPGAPPTGQRPGAPAAPAAPAAGYDQQLAEAMLWSYKSNAPGAAEALEKLVREYVSAYVPNADSPEMLPRALPAALKIVQRKNPKLYQNLKQRFAPHLTSGKPGAWYKPWTYGQKGEQRVNLEMRDVERAMGKGYFEQAPAAGAPAPSGQPQPAPAPGAEAEFNEPAWFGAQPRQPSVASRQAALGKVNYQGDTLIPFALSGARLEGGYLTVDVTWDPDAPQAEVAPEGLRYHVLSFVRREATHGIDRYGFDFGRMRGRPVVVELDAEAGVAVVRMRVKGAGLPQTVHVAAETNA